MGTAAILIIGDEILTAKFQDENGPWALARLRVLGVAVDRLVILPDTVEAIAEEVARAAARCDVVFTSGGVGPTHDDRTFEGVAAAFGLALEERAELVAAMEGFRMPLTPLTLRMARVPAGAALLREADARYPVVRVRNVYILPGVPALFRQKFEAVAPSFAAPAVAVGRLRADDDEAEVAGAMARAAAQWPGVAIGSYPRYGEPDGRLLVTFEGTDVEAVRAAMDEVAATLRLRSVVRP
jgi:molybdenum cofactor synthesis domain-containing protein